MALGVRHRGEDQETLRPVGLEQRPAVEFEESPPRMPEALRRAGGTEHRVLGPDGLELPAGRAQDPDEFRGARVTAGAWVRTVEIRHEQAAPYGVVAAGTGRPGGRIR